MSKSHSFTIYNASAGSGKTYTLTKEYLKIILNANQNDAYKRILAITFTNKAVEEMKNRIIDSLFAFTKEKTAVDKENLLNDLIQETGLSEVQIKKKSKAIIKDIIHNYSAFGISTIDKFTHRVIRSFAQDLELPSNFEVVLDTEALLQEAIDLVISKVGEDTLLTNLLVDFTKAKTDDDKNWDISKELLEISKLLINENHTEEITAFKDKNFEDFKKVKQRLHQKIEELTQDSKERGKQLKEFIAVIGIDSNLFYSTFINHLNNIENNEIKPTQKKYWEPEDIKIKKTAKDADIIQENIEEILAQLSAVYTNYGRIAFYEAFLKNINPLTLLSTISNEFKKIQEEQNVLSISDFNKIIHNEIQNQPAPFIYERLGEKYKHYFIDEFQDTSTMQWNNLIPLIDNALSSEENGVKGSLMLVGDPKQSIYRWRGGKAEQFIALSKEDNPNDKNQNPFSNKDKKVIDLETNYRSYSEIITFNNSFFKFLASKFETEDYADLYSNHSYQKSNAKTGGYINISFIQSDQTETEDYAEESEYSFKTQQYLEQTLATIKQAEANGFLYNEMVLLTRKTKEGVFLANFLTENNIPILSSETLLIQNATEVKLIIALLRFLNNGNDYESKAYLLYYVAKYCQNEKNVHDFIFELKNANEKEIEQAFQKIGIEISFQNCRTKSLYEAVETLVNAFIQKKANTSYVQYFLDLVLEKNSKAQNGIAEFLDYWNKTGFKKSIPSPEGIDAVRIMTIHKSKGLEFPVVIFPFAEEDFSRMKSDKLWVDIEESAEIDFPKALINAKKDVVTYSEKAQEVYLQKNEEAMLDIVNVLYVALTRAKEQLYIISTKIETKKGFSENNLSYFFIEYLQIIDRFNNEDFAFDFGNSQRVSSVSQSNQISKPIEHVKNKLPFNNIKIAKREALLWNTTQEKAINYGNILHEILAFIKTKNDVDLAVEKAIETGLISFNESEKIKQLLLEVVNNDNLKDFFDPNVKVYNEHTIIDSEFGNIKPDRVVVYTKNAFLLDYKTGDKKNSHKNQLNKYANALQKMNFVVVKKALVYITEEIEVVLL